MANKHMKRCSTLLITREMQIKTTMTSHWSQWPSSKRLQTINAGKVWRKGNPVALLVGMEIDTATMENSMDIPLKTRNKTNI